MSTRYAHGSHLQAAHCRSIIGSVFLAVLSCVSPSLAQDNLDAWEHCWVDVCGQKHAQCLQDCWDRHDGGRDELQCMRRCNRDLKRCERGCEFLKDADLDDLVLYWVERMRVAGRATVGSWA